MYIFTKRRWLSKPLRLSPVLPFVFAGEPVARSLRLMLVPVVEPRVNPKPVEPTGTFTRPAQCVCANGIAPHPSPLTPYVSPRPLPLGSRVRYTSWHEY